jgi:hypothetical protein
MRHTVAIGRTRRWGLHRLRRGDLGWFGWEDEGDGGRVDVGEESQPPNADNEREATMSGGSAEQPLTS